MKTKVIIALFLIVLNLAVFATEKEGDAKGTLVKVEKVENSIFNLVYSGTDARNVSIKILNAKGNVVFTENIRKIDSFSRPYNFSQLPEGIYTLEISDKNGKITEQVDYRVGSTVKPSFNYINVSHMPNQADHYKLTIVNGDELVADVKILDTDNHVLYTSTENIDGNFAKLYDLSKVQGNVRFEISLAGEIKSFIF